jgi:hypothetical protein
MLLHEGAWILEMKLRAFPVQVMSSLVDYIFSFQEICVHVVAVCFQIPCSPKRC